MKDERDSWLGRLLDACDVAIRRLLFLDEPRPNTDMLRIYGRSARGDRCFDSATSGD